MPRGRRKIEAEFTAKVAHSSAPGFEDDLFVTEMELKTLDLYTAQAAMSTAIRDKFNLKEELLRITYERERAEIRAHQLNAEKSRMEAIERYNKTRGDIQKRLGINLDEYVIDDVTGKCRKVSETGPS